MGLQCLTLGELERAAKDFSEAQRLQMRQELSPHSPFASGHLYPWLPPARTATDV
jgi:hypothetical protein